MVALDSGGCEGLHKKTSSPINLQRPSSSLHTDMPDLDSQLAACSHERLLPQSVGKQVLITVAGFTAVLLVVMEIKARQDDLRINYYPPK